MKHCYKPNSYSKMQIKNTLVSLSPMGGRVSRIPEFNDIVGYGKNEEEAIASINACLIYRFNATLKESKTGISIFLLSE